MLWSARSPPVRESETAACARRRSDRNRCRARPIVLVSELGPLHSWFPPPPLLHFGAGKFFERPIEQQASVRQEVQHPAHVRRRRLAASSQDKLNDGNSIYA